MTMTDPVANAFTAQVPAGWDSVVYTDGQIGVYRFVVNSISASGQTVLYTGDPKMPQYWAPGSGNPTVEEFADVLEHAEVRAYDPASSYFPAYTESKFGGLPGFAITAVEQDAAFIAELQQQMANAGLPVLGIDAVRVFFDYTADGLPLHGVIVGSTIDSGMTWGAYVSGLSTSGDVVDYLPMLTTMSQSVRTTPDFNQRQQAEFAQQDAQMQAFGEQLSAQHDANMAAIQNSADRHQERMQAIWAAGDASMQSYNERMATGDEIQRGFLNYINDEETVVGSGGQTYQVQTGFQRYFVNPIDNSYVGGDITFDDDDIRQLGLDPAAYQEVQPKG
ncbi:hypothetical protein ACEXQD_06340 [Herbiconiux sp. P15]|uniref:hypothetical protein n=1 Tax=Herbiconiux liukaitaii TaxID=3342799 RepID=UPI0035B96CA7